MICKKCGKEIKEENNFCTNCGTSIEYTGKENKFVKYEKQIKAIFIIIILILSIYGLSKLIVIEIDEEIMIENIYDNPVSETDTSKNESQKEDILEEIETDVVEQEKEENIDKPTEEDNEEEQPNNNSDYEEEYNENLNNNNVKEDYNNDTNNYYEEEYEEPQEEIISLAGIDTETKSFEEVKKEIENMGLRVQTEEETREISLFEYPKEPDYYISGTEFKKGDIVMVYITYYEPEELIIKFDLEISFYEHSYYYNNEYAVGYLKEDKSQYGLQVYFNDELVYTGDENFIHTFTENKDIQIKVVAPFLYTSSEEPLKDVVLLDKTFTLQELQRLYNGNRSFGIPLAFL